MAGKLVEKTMKVGAKATKASFSLGAGTRMNFILHQFTDKKTKLGKIKGAKYKIDCQKQLMKTTIQNMFNIECFVYFYFML